LLRKLFRSLTTVWNDRHNIEINEHEVEIYVETNKVPFLDVALDEGGRSWYPYRVSGLPAAVVIDQKGIVRWRGHYTFMGHTLLDTLLAE
jgi:hypothetical protein